MNYALLTCQFFLKNNGQFQVKLDMFHYVLLYVAYILFYGTD